MTSAALRHECETLLDELGIAEILREHKRKIVAAFATRIQAEALSVHKPFLNALVTWLRLSPEGREANGITSEQQAELLEGVIQQTQQDKE